MYMQPFFITHIQSSVFSSQLRALSLPKGQSSVFQLNTDYLSPISNIHFGLRSSDFGLNQPINSITQ